MMIFLKRIAIGSAALAAVVLLGHPASATDLLTPRSSPVADAAPAESMWTGFYIEGGLGMTSSGMESSSGGESLAFADTSWVGHIGVGYDHMILPHIVVGVLARAQIDNLDYKAIDTSMADRDIEYMVGGRLGFVPRQDWMVYGLIGYRFAGLEWAPDTMKLSADQNGWVAGGGIEAMLTDHMFIGAEYTVNLTGGDTLDEGTANTPRPFDVSVTDHAGKARIGWRF